MNRWCMRNTKGLETSASIWLMTNDLTKPGAPHDGVNILYPWLPPAKLLAGLEVKLVYNYELADTSLEAAILDIVKQSAKFMLSDSSNILTGAQWMFEAMHRTAYHRLWCKRYGESQANVFEGDFFEVFNTPAGSTSKTQASAMIKSYFTP